MQNYGIHDNDTIVIRKLEQGEVLENCLVIIDNCKPDPYTTATDKSVNEFYIHYYDKKSNQLLAGSKDLAPIPYSPELIVPARITSIIRPL